MQKISLDHVEISLPYLIWNILNPIKQFERRSTTWQLELILIFWLKNLNILISFLPTLHGPSWPRLVDTQACFLDSLSYNCGTRGYQPWPCKHCSETGKPSSCQFYEVLRYYCRVFDTNFVFPWSSQNVGNWRICLYCVCYWDSADSSRVSEILVLIEYIKSNVYKHP